jgi:enamine deaminase RidA (YjgF/YER057c/UK114 family)
VKLEIVNPDSLSDPKGFSHGILAPPGARVLFVAGQAGWDEAAGYSALAHVAAGEEAPSDPADFPSQFSRALDRVLAVVKAAGGAPADVARLTVYVVDLDGYMQSRALIGRAWRERFGNYYPAMSLLHVSGLVDKGALVEIEATAVLPGPGKNAHGA